MTLTEELLDELGDSLRTVALARFDEGEYDIEYMRTDISEQYSEAEIGQIYQDIGVRGFAKAMEETLYEPLGESQGMFGVFERGINVVRWDESGKRAIFVGLDPDLEDACRVFDRTADVFPLEESAE